MIKNSIDVRCHNRKYKVCYKILIKLKLFFQSKHLKIKIISRIKMYVTFVSKLTEICSNFKFVITFKVLL